MTRQEKLSQEARFNELVLNTNLSKLGTIILRADNIAMGYSSYNIIGRYLRMNGISRSMVNPTTREFYGTELTYLATRACVDKFLK